MFFSKHLSKKKSCHVSEKDIFKIVFLNSNTRLRRIQTRGCKDLRQKAKDYSDQRPRRNQRKDQEEFRQNTENIKTEE